MRLLKTVTFSIGILAMTVVFVPEATYAHPGYPACGIQPQSHTANAFGGAYHGVRVFTTVLTGCMVKASPGGL